MARLLRVEVVATVKALPASALALPRALIRAASADPSSAFRGDRPIDAAHPLALAPGGQVVRGVTLAPPAPGASSGTLEAVATGAAPVTSARTGTGDTPTLAVSVEGASGPPGPLDFGGVTVGVTAGPVGAPARAGVDRAVLAFFLPGQPMPGATLPLTGSGAAPQEMANQGGCTVVSARNSSPGAAALAILVCLVVVVTRRRTREVR